MVAVAFTRRYSMAHRLLADPRSKCAIPHGHNELVTVRLSPLTSFRFGGANMIAPFEAVKRRWHRFVDDHVDHAFQLNEEDPLLAWFRAHEPAAMPRLMTFVGDPTTEALAAAFWLKLDAFVQIDALPFAVAEVRIEETPTNTVILTRESFDPRACDLPEDRWPHRADFSINDFDR
jgi:6-pyruvoyltetrahydropterin/6-carboxytetrahydropterin synthase